MPPAETPIVAAPAGVVASPNSGPDGGEGGGRRFRFIDALRGVAALAVLIYHLYGSGPLRENLASLLPRALDLLIMHGFLGVEVFFVLSGFVIAYSLRRARVTPGYLAGFALRRSMRLDPPYWATIVLVYVLLAVSNHFLTDRQADLPTWPQTLAHLFYVQHLVGMGDIVPVFWTLCLEVQFYLVFAILLGLTQASRARLNPGVGATVEWLVWSALLTLSILAYPKFYLPGGRAPLDLGPWQLWFLGPWQMFFLGALGWWTVEGRVRPVWLWLAMAMIGTRMMLVHWSIEQTVAVAAAAAIAATARAGRLETLGRSAWLQYFGRISYSLYLIHPVIGGRIENLGWRLTKSTPGSVVLFFLAVAGSIAAAHLLHVMVERPSLRLAQRLKEYWNRPKPAQVP